MVDCPNCQQSHEAGAFHMCPQPISKLDRRPRLIKMREWLLGWLRLQIVIQLGMLGISIQVRQFAQESLNLHLCAAMLSFGSRQLGAVLETALDAEGSLRLRLHGIWIYKEFYL